MQPPERFEFTLRPSFVLVLGLFALCGYVLHPYAVLFGDVSTPAVTYAVVFGVGLALLVAVHEAGHVLEASRRGFTFAGVRLGAKISVIVAGDHTDTSIRWTAAAGPALGFTAALIVVAATPAWSPLWAAGVVAALENVANALLFFVPGADGNRILRGLKSDGSTEEVPA